jgi:hypothetical protein
MRAALGFLLRSRRSTPAGRPRRTPTALQVVVGLALAPSLACGALCQNLRSQFVSYRGAWSCAAASCSSSDVVQSKAGSNKGELRINDVKLQPHAGLVFYPGTPVKDMTATVRDCKGKAKDVPSDKVQPPGRHKIKGEPDSWVIWLDEALVADLEVGSDDCAVLVVKTHSTWADGKVYDAEGAIKVGG